MPKLLAIVEVEKSKRVRCQHEGCGLAVYKAIHVVREDDGSLMVLGSTCFAKRYLGVVMEAASIQSGSDGRKLTDAERQLLIENTAQLIEQFANEAAELEARYRARMQLLPPTPSPAPRAQVFVARPCPALNPIASMPWDWVKPMSSVGYFHLRDGSGWMRVMNANQEHVIVPWPNFDGWDEALPSAVGIADEYLGGYLAQDVASAIAYLRANRDWEKIGSWRDVMEEITKRGSALA